MRSILLAFLVAGCSSGGTPPTSVPDAAVLPDAHLEPNPGAVGSTCNTSCDCQPGLGCVNTKCSQTTSPQYCCQSPTCPSGASCQSASGTYGRCGSGATTGGTSGGTTGGSTGATGGLTGGLPGGIIGGLTGGSGGLPDLDGGLGGFTTGGTTAGIDTDGGLTGGTTGGNQCSTTLCQGDADCTAAGCAKCNIIIPGLGGNCQ